MKLSFSPSEIRNVIFDFGGVLFDIDYHAPARAFRELGVERFEEIYSKATQTDVFDLLETGKISNSDFLDYLQRFVPDHVSRKQVLDAWNCILTGMPKERADALHTLQDHRLFLLSNTNAIHVEEFEQMVDKTVGLDYFKSAFEQVYYSNVIGIRKPHPETYLQVCQWNDLKPEETLFIDDSPQHVAGAKQAGLHAFHLQVEHEDVRELISLL